MLKFNIIELINKILGIFITSLTARILTTEELGIFLYYQTLLGQFLIFSIFSTDYQLLINYSIDKDYVNNSNFYRTINIRILLTVISLLMVSLLVQPSEKIAFWPLLLSIGSCIWVFDSILYAENQMNKVVIVRFSSQIFSFIFLLFFYYKFIDAHYITFVQVLQTLILTFGTFVFANRFLGNNLFIRAVKSMSFFDKNLFKELLYFFLVRNFIVFITTIEVTLFNYLHLDYERNIFSEGLRLSVILTPFAVFYVRFNMTSLHKYYTLYIQLASVILLFISPLYVIALFGFRYTQHIYYYNFFIIVFLFNALIEGDYANILTNSKSKIEPLVILNVIYFFCTTVIMLYFAMQGTTIEVMIFLFLLKFIIYYFYLCSFFFERKILFWQFTMCSMIIALINFLFVKYRIYDYEILKIHDFL